MLSHADTRASAVGAASVAEIPSRGDFHCSSRVDFASKSSKIARGKAGAETLHGNWDVLHSRILRRKDTKRIGCQNDT